MRFSPIAMLEQKGWQMRIEDFTDNLVKFADLVYYDGPLLSHYTNRSRTKHYLFHWLDNDTERNRWLVMEVNLSHLFDYLSDTRTLLDICQQEYNNKLIVAETNPTGAFTSGLLVPITELNPDYLPESDSYFEASLVMEMMPNYVTLFQTAQQSVKHAEYLEKMRSKAVRFRLEPIGEAYGTTLGATDIGSFLQKITRSFRSYLEVCLPSLFSNRFVADDLAKMMNKLLETSSDPRAVFANHGSFEIELAVDVLHLTGIDNDIITWQRQALQEYKRDVFDFDFANAEQLPHSLAEATNEQLRAIYQPVVLIANNSNYNVKARTAVAENYKILKPVSRQNAHKVAPPKARELTDEQLDTELTNVLFELQRGQDPRTLTLTQLRRAVVAVTSGDESITHIGEFTSSEGLPIILREPIEVVLSRVGDYYEAKYESLDIDKLGASAKAALTAVDDELRLIYSQYQQRLENPDGPIGEKQGRRLSNFRDLL